MQSKTQSQLGPNYADLFNFANLTSGNSKYVKRSLQQKFRSIRAKLKMSKAMSGHSEELIPRSGYQSCPGVELVDCSCLMNRGLVEDEANWIVCSVNSSLRRADSFRNVCKSADLSSRTSTPIAHNSSSKLLVRNKSVKRHKNYDSCQSSHKPRKISKKRAKVETYSVICVKEEKSRRSNGPINGKANFNLINHRFLMNMMERSITDINPVEEFQNYGELKVWYV